MLTILTRPGLDSFAQLWTKSSPLAQTSRNSLRTAWRALSGRGIAARHSGHSGVTGSVMRGLARLDIDYQLNPLRIGSGSTVGILSGQQTLRWAVQRPPSPSDTRYVVGPNVYVLASENPAAFLSERVTGILVPSEWVLGLWSNDMPEISHKLTVWACGVNFDFWRQTNDSVGGRLPLIYSKVHWPGLESSVTQALDRLGLDYRLVRYGSYSARAFRSVLEQASCVIYLGGSESQGLALLESWAMGVPTFVFDAPHQDVHLAGGRSMRLERGQFSPAPYLSPQSGGLWSTQEELVHLIQKAESFSPRESVLGFFSDEARAAGYARILRDTPTGS